MSDLQIDIERRDGVAIVTPRGDVDMATSPRLRTELKKLIAAGTTRIVVDLSHVPYMDSSGVATLVEAMKSLRQVAGSLALCNMNPRVRAIFEIARLDQYFTICESIEEALPGT